MFQRQGDDLLCSVELPMTAAALGAALPLQTLDGERTVEVRPGTQPGDTITLRGLGVTHLRTHERGDLLVHANVRTPTRLDGGQEDLLRQARSLARRAADRQLPAAQQGAIRQAARRPSVMTAPLFFVDAGALAGMAPGSVVVLDGPEGRHAATVRRIGPGSRCRLPTAPDRWRPVR